MNTLLPPCLLEALASRYGEAAEAIAAGYPARRPVTLRVNRLKTTPEAVREALAAAGLAFEPVDWYADALVLPGAAEADLRALPMYAAGEIYLQSLSAMLPPLLFALKEGESVLDMAAAPGGKSCQLAALSGGSVSLTVCEKNPIRFDRLKANLAQQGVKRVTALRQDARELSDFFRFDHILLDAPCSGSGTLLPGGEKPRRMEADWVRRLTLTQRALIRKAVKLLSPGGDLVYATCSILEEENEAIVREALQLGCELLPVPDALGRAVPTLPVSLPGVLCVRPTALYEGFFTAWLRKTA